MFSRSGIKVVEDFPIISNLAVTTRITINFSRADFFSSGSLNGDNVLSLHLDLKIVSVYNMVNLFLWFVLALFLNQMKAYLNMVKRKLIPF